MFHLYVGVIILQHYVVSLQKFLYKVAVLEAYTKSFKKLHNNIEVFRNQYFILPLQNTVNINILINFISFKKAFEKNCICSISRSISPSQSTIGHKFSWISYRLINYKNNWLIFLSRNCYVMDAWYQILLKLISTKFTNILKCWVLMAQYTVNLNKMSPVDPASLVYVISL